MFIDVELARGRLKRFDMVIVGESGDFTLSRLVGVMNSLETNDPNWKTRKI